MKISKLFHWLYALLMLLPIFAIGVTCGYAIFNKNAYQSYSSSQSPNTYLSENSITNLTKNKVYQITTNNQFYLAENQTINVSQIVMIKSPNGYTGLNKTPLEFEQYINQNGYFLHIRYSDNSNDYLKYANVDYTYIAEIQFNFVPWNNYNTYNYTNWTKEIIFGTQQSIDNVFYYSIDKVIQSPLFNWAYNSNILGVPISYIGGIFGLVSNSIINVLLCYWVAISIIWLVFDILMFVPLLVHKSIDKMRF